MMDIYKKTYLQEEGPSQKYLELRYLQPPGETVADCLQLQECRTLERQKLHRLGLQHNGRQSMIVYLIGQKQLGNSASIRRG